MRKPVHLRKTKTGSFADGFSRDERIEHLGDDIVRYAYAIILYGYLDVVLFRVIGRSDSDGAAIRQRISRVYDEIQKRRLEFARVDNDVPDAVLDVDTELDHAAEAYLQNVPKRIEPLGQPYGFGCTLWRRAKLSNWRVREEARCDTVSMDCTALIDLVLVTSFLIVWIPP